MKKVFVMIMATSLLMACKSGTNPTDTRTITPAQTHGDQETKTGALVLNHGAKWKADSATHLNVAQLQAAVSSAKRESLEDYQQTAVQLQEGLNKMVKECRMKGADHDALHTWLEPLMDKTKELKNQTTAEEAAPTLKEIEKQVALFPQYFE